MSFEFQSTLVNVTPSYRIGGSQIGGVRMEKVGDIDTIRLIITNDADIRFAASGPFESGDPAVIYAALAADLYEIAPGVLINEGAIGSIEINPDEIVIDLEGSDRKFKLSPDSEILEATEVADHNWKLTTASFDSLTTAAGAWRSSMDGTLEGLSVSIATEIADRIAAISGVQADVDQNESDADAAIAAEAARVDALIASGMWLFDDQASFPPAADNHGRVVHSHADGAIFYAHGGVWHQVAKEVDLQSTIDSVASEASTREAADTALSGRLDVLEADPTTATAVAAGDTATLSSANSYTDTSITNLVNGADTALDTLKEIGDALAAGDSDVTAALTAQITTESTARANADSALSGRLDVLEADPTTQSALDAEVTARNSGDSALDGRVTALEGNSAITDPTTATAVAAVQSDVDANEADADAAIAGLDGRLGVLEADPTTATAVAAVQADVDQNEADADAAIAAEASARVAGDAASNAYTDSQIAAVIGAAPEVLNTLEEIANSINDDEDVYTSIVSQIVSGDTSEATTREAADTALSGRLDTLEADPTTATAVAAVQADVDQNETDSDAADAALSGRLDVLEADPTTATAVAAVQADVDQNEADGDAADAALSGRLDTLEADPTTATAVAAVQADVDQNEADADAADAALSGRLDVLEADPTTATAVAAVQSDVDQNEADADAALALKAPLADPDFTGQLEVDTNARLEFDSNLTKISNVLRGTDIEIGNNITLNPAAADGRVEIEGGLYLRPSDIGNYANDVDAAAAGVVVGGIYHHNGDLKIRLA